MIDILLATHNGERYVAELLQSLLAQSYPSWRLLVSDDGSIDRTPDILRDFQRRLPDRVRLCSRRTRRNGACGNFAHLLALAEGDYVMPCDQDDVWMPDKIDKTLAAMRAAERRVGSARPVLVFTDLRVVDADRRLIDPSLWHYQRIDPKGVSVGCLLTRNVINGCTVMANRALVRLALPQPSEAIVHDWWLAILACVLGRIEHVPEALVEYRQHGGNDIGARDMTLGALLRRGPRQLLRRQIRLRNRTILQARAVLRRIEDRVGGPDRVEPDPLSLTAVREYAAAHPWLKRRWVLWRHGMLQGNLYVRLARAFLF
jgi:glycosyltransferase involved in cell wall biosynthesis